MNYFEYVDFKPIPTELLESIDEIKIKENYSYIHKENYPLKSYPYLEGKPVKNDLKLYLESIFPFEIGCTYQIVYPGLTIHKDTHRLSTYLYLMELGGDNVYTNFYDDDKKLLESFKFVSNKWLKLNAQIYHNVTGIDNNKVRVAVSATAKADYIKNPVPKNWLTDLGSNQGPTD